ncbi:hypothetical protein IJJ08_01335 [bacterium]|nr:hypothetical protein [bacterium]
MAISQYLRDFLADWQQDYDYRNRAVVESFEVDDLALSVGRFYEKIRKVIDWKDEHALKRGAIARAINRDLIPQIGYLNLEAVDQKTLDLAETMVFELMRSGYFDNKLINADTVETLGVIVHKYLVAFCYLNSSQDGLSKRDLKDRIRLQNWTIQIMACEIEELLAPSYKIWALINLMDTVLADRIRVIPVKAIDDFTQDKLRLIAVLRSLYDMDDYLIAYELLKMYEPDFNAYDHLFDLEAIQKMYQDKLTIEHDLASQSGRQFLRIACKYDAAYRMIGAIAQSLELTKISDGEEFFADEDKVEARYREIYADKYKSLKSRLLKTAFWTTLSVIIANFASVIIIEWPVAEYFGLGFGPSAIAFDILIPCVAMFILVMLIRPPKRENEAVAWSEIKKIIYDSSEQDTYEIRRRQRGPNKIVQAFFYLTTILAGGVGLWALYLMFKAAGLPITSVYLNVVYITMVLFASLNIRSQAQELTVFEKSTLLDFVLDIFSIPLARIGQWFSKKWKEYNIFSIIFSLLIDSPLSNFIGFIEDWRNYLKENKSEIR